MDKPLGPRQPPPDKRHAAYESIFGRPGVSHHKPPASQSYHIPDKRPSYDTPFSPSPSLYYPSQPSRQFYPSPGPSNFHTLPNYVQPPYPSYPPVSRVNSTNSPVPYMPQNIIHDSVPLAPAQSYQAQVYINGPNGNSNSSGPPTDWPRTSPAPPERHSHPPTQNGGPSPLPDPPKLGISLEHDDGRLGIDFVSGNENNSLDTGQDESGSELPWARDEDTGTHLFFCCIQQIIHLF